MVIWVKFTHSSHFSSLIPRMSMFTLAVSCLTTSNLPWFMDLTFQVPMQYCSLQHQTLLLLFLLWLHPFILSGVISPLISSSILVTYWPGDFLFQYPIILPFHTVHGSFTLYISYCSWVILMSLLSQKIQSKLQIRVFNKMIASTIKIKRRNILYKIVTSYKCNDRFHLKYSKKDMNN